MADSIFVCRDCGSVLSCAAGQRIVRDEAGCPFCGSKRQPAEGVGPSVKWAVSSVRRRRGELLTRGDVCHLHVNREDAERCGAIVAEEEGTAPDLLKLEGQTERVYRVTWSLSDVADGRLRRPAPSSVPQLDPGPFNAPRLT